MSAVTVVIPNWNGARWLPGCLASLAAQTEPPAEVIVVDNGSTDDSLSLLAAEHPDVRVLAMGRNTGFAHAANAGLRAAAGELVALINTDVEVAPDWLARCRAALARHPEAAAVACKMLSPPLRWSKTHEYQGFSTTRPVACARDKTRPSSLEPGRAIYDAGDVLRRDGACVQRGRFERDDGRYDEPGEVFGACAGAALYRRAAVLGVGGFDETYFAYLEDVDLALALRRAGWRCRYEPAIALHAGEGSSGQLAGGHHFYVARNTLVLVAKWFPVRWLPLVAYRQLSWLREAARERRLRVHLRAVAASIALLPGAIRRRRKLRSSDAVAIEQIVPAVPIRGPRAAGHRSRIDASWRDTGL